MHCHFRTGELLATVLPETVRYARRAIAMPNTRPRAVLSAADVVWYRGQIEGAMDHLPGGTNFTPLMTIEIRDTTTPAIVRGARRAGAVAGKVYPLGVTTNSDAGLRDFFSPAIQETFQVMSDVGMHLLIHGEIDLGRTLVTDRERVFLPTIQRLSEMFPKLKIVLEHVSTTDAVRMVEALPDNVAATITAHHLCLTLNNVVGDGIRPHNMCMPVPKGFKDRDALVEAATGGNPKFFFGSDSAPHLKGHKECARGACGVYSAPVLMSVLAEVFEAAGRLDRLDDFASRFGAEFYGLPRNESTLTLVREDWRVSEEVNGIVPFRAGEILHWRVLDEGE